ncbi:MATE family efflux transporter [Escherichia coli]
MPYCWQRLFIIFGEQIIDFVAGDATTEVKALALTYLELTVPVIQQLPSLLLVAGHFVVQGNTKIPLLINGSLNILNIIISGILIYGLFSPGRDWDLSGQGWV